jgi:recombinational DNA repair protein RecR
VSTACAAGLHFEAGKGCVPDVAPVSPSRPPVSSESTCPASAPYRPRNADSVCVADQHRFEKVWQAYMEYRSGIDRCLEARDYEGRPHCAECKLPEHSRSSLMTMKARAVPIERVMDSAKLNVLEGFVSEMQRMHHECVKVEACCREKHKDRP